MKNHILAEGKLLQTNKKFSHLKDSQKEKINGWLYEEYSSLWKECGKEPGQSQKETIVDNVYTKIKEAEIWLPLDELYAYYEAHINKFKKDTKKAESRKQYENRKYH